MMGSGMGLRGIVMDGDLDTVVKYDEVKVSGIVILHI